MAPNRDKRVISPVLQVDLFERPVPVIQWLQTGVVLSRAASGLGPGDRVWCVVSSGPARRPHKSGLCELVIDEVVGNERNLLASFAYIEPEVEQILHVLPTGKGLPAEEAPSLLLARTRPTINWSLSGVLLDYDGPQIASGSRIHGIVHTPHQHRVSSFSAVVIRTTPTPPRAALKFQTLSAELFEVLETAIRRHAATVMAR